MAAGFGSFGSAKGFQWLPLPEWHQFGKGSWNQFCERATSGQEFVSLGPAENYEPTA